MDEEGRARNRARKLEAAGQVDSAVRLYLEAGGFVDAVRALTLAKRWADAGWLVLEWLEVTPDDVGALQGTKRNQARRAAQYFASGGEIGVAKTIFAALGDSGEVEAPSSARGRPPAPSAGAPASGRKSGARVINQERARGLENDGAFDMAMQAYVKLRMYSDAGRLCRKMGDLVAAAEWYIKAARYFEAADCYLETGDTGQGLETLVRVGRDDPNYRVACMRAIKIAASLNTIDFELDRFLTRFVRSEANSIDELEALQQLGGLYEHHGFPNSAVDVYRRILEADPGNADAAARLERVEADDRGSNMVFEKIVREEDAFHDSKRRRYTPAADLESLPDLPDLPDLSLEMPEYHEELAEPFVEEPIEPERNPTPLRGSMVGGKRPRSTGIDEFEQSVGPASGDSSPRSAPVAEPVRGSTAPRDDDDDTSWNDAVDPDDESLDGTLPVNTVIGKRYRVRRLLGQGGMAAVYEVLDLELEITIALKLFAADVSNDALLTRFRRELKLTRELQHDNIVRVYDIGVHRGRRFLTMEKLSGTDMRAALSQGALDLVVAIDYLRGACAGLHAAHLRGVIHRDIKPDNFFVTDSGQVKVMDFGIARNVNDARRVTQEGFIAGTPEYMAPEQIMDFGKVTHHCDIYALGIVAFELLTGDVPFLHEESMALLMMHLNNPPPAPSEIRFGIPPELDELVLRTLSKKPQDRIATCEQFGQELTAIRATLS